MSKMWKSRPSEILRIDDPLIAYWFDRAIFYFGVAYENDIQDATKDAKSDSQAERAAQVVQERWLRDQEEPVNTPPQTSDKPKFRDPAEMFK